MKIKIKNKRFKRVPLISLTKNTQVLPKTYSLGDVLKEHPHIFLRNSFFNSFIYLFLKNKFFKNKKFILYFFILILSFYISKYLILRKIKYLRTYRNVKLKIKNIKKSRIKFKYKRRNRYLRRQIRLDMKRLKRKKIAKFRILIKYLRKKWKRQIYYLSDLFFSKKIDKFPIFLKRYQSKLMKIMKIRRFPLFTSSLHLSSLNLNFKKLKHFKSTLLTSPLSEINQLSSMNLDYLSNLNSSRTNLVNYFLFILLGHCIKQPILYSFFFKQFVVKKLVTYLYYFNTHLVQSQYRNMLYFRNYPCTKIKFKYTIKHLKLKLKSHKRYKQKYKYKYRSKWARRSKGLIKHKIHNFGLWKNPFSLTKLALIYIPSETLNINENLKIMRFNLLYNTFYNIGRSKKDIGKISFKSFLNLKRKIMRQYYINNIVLANSFSDKNKLLKHIAQR